MRPRALLITTAALELPTGLALLLMPAVVGVVLLGEELVEPASFVIARVAGTALVAIGASCWLARNGEGASRRTDLIVGLFIYNAAVTVLLGHAAVVLGMRGILLWPAVVVHTALALWCVACLRELAPRP